MAIVKRIVCLSNSRKLQGRCIAGREIVGGRPAAWIRPVSDRQHAEVSEYERQYQDGRDPKVLDVIDIPLREPQPEGCQRENWLLDPKAYWVRVGRFPRADLEKLTDSAGTLWINGYHASQGVNDRIPIELAVKLENSLKLVRVDKLRLNVCSSGEEFGNTKRRVQARFRFAGNNYALWVTDPIIERTYLSREDGEYRLGEKYLTVSLGEPYNGYCYKLVAAVIKQE